MDKRFNTPVLWGARLLCDRSAQHRARADRFGCKRQEKPQPISLFGLGSGAVLATVVGVLVEVPVMLSLVAFANITQHWFPAERHHT